MQGLFAEAVASQQQAAAAFVVESESEHATQLGYAVGAHFFVEVDNGFGVTIRDEAVAAAFEIGTKFLEVVDLAIEDDPDGTVFIEDGLMTAGNVDNAEAGHAEAGTILREDALIVGAAMNDGLTHPVDGGGFDSIASLAAHDACDSAHSSILSR
jgi:hypothetical protein